MVPLSCPTPSRSAGSIGGTYTRPLLVVPEVMIGALGKFQALPRYDAKHQIHPSTIMVRRVPERVLW